MYQLTQLAADQHRQRLAAAEAQRPAERALALTRATRRAERAERRMRRAARQAGQLRAFSSVGPAAAPGRNKFSRFHVPIRVMRSQHLPSCRSARSSL